MELKVLNDTFVAKLMQIWRYLPDCKVGNAKIKDTQSKLVSGIGQEYAGWSISTWRFDFVEDISVI
jgi:hypothetical protein